MPLAFRPGMGRFQIAGKAREILERYCWKEAKLMTLPEEESFVSAWLSVIKGAEGDSQASRFTFDKYSYRR